MSTPVGFFLRTARQYARIGWIRKSQFRWEFFNQVAMDGLYYLSFLLTFHILYGFGEGLTLAGWSRDDIRVFLGMAFVSDAFMMTWLGQSWHFGDDLKSGRLDAFRLRPGPVWFTYTFQRFSPEGLTNMAVAVSILGFGMVLHPDVGWANALVLPFVVALAFVAQAALSVLLQGLEFWLVNSDLSRLFTAVFHHVSDRPMDVYPRRMKHLFVWIVPLGALSWFPAGVVVGRHGPGFIALYALVILVFAWLATRVFRRGMGRYESAMG